MAPENKSYKNPRDFLNERVSSTETPAITQYDTELYKNLLKNAQTSSENPTNYVSPEGKTYNFLGKGSFGVVYEDPDNPGQVLKILQGKSLNNPEDVERAFFTEVDNLFESNLKAPGLTPRIRTTDWYPSENLGVIRMDKAQGIAGNMSREAVLGVIKANRDLAEKAGLMQLDPHLGNYFLNPETNKVQLIDLGMATKDVTSPEALSRRMNNVFSALSVGGNEDLAEIFYDTAKEIKDPKQLEDLVIQGESLYNTIDPTNKYTNVFENKYPNWWKESVKTRSPTIPSAARAASPRMAGDVFNEVSTNLTGRLKPSDIRGIIQRNPTGLTLGASTALLNPDIAREVERGNYVAALGTAGRDIATGAAVEQGIRLAGAATPAVTRAVPAATPVIRAATPVLRAATPLVRVAGPVATGAALFTQGQPGSLSDVVTRAAAANPVSWLPAVRANPQTDIGARASRAIGNEARYALNQLLKGKIPYFGR